MITAWMLNCLTDCTMMVFIIEHHNKIRYAHQISPSGGNLIATRNNLCLPVLAILVVYLLEASLRRSLPAKGDAELPHFCPERRRIHFQELCCTLFPAYTATGHLQGIDNRL
jgi:hypothetical protein